MLKCESVATAATRERIPNERTKKVLKNLKKFLTKVLECGKIKARR